MNVLIQVALSYLAKHPDQIERLLEAGVEALIAAIKHSGAAQAAK
jgi:cytochrome P450